MLDCLFWMLKDSYFNVVKVFFYVVRIRFNVDFYFFLGRLGLFRNYDEIKNEFYEVF